MRADPAAARTGTSHRVGQQLLQVRLSTPSAFSHFRFICEAQLMQAFLSTEIN
jgi:hypothetical protein